MTMHEGAPACAGRMRRGIQVRMGMLFLVLVAMPVHAEQAQTVPGGSVQAPAAAQQGVVKFTPNMPANALAGRPDTDLVELSDGRRIRLGDLRRLKAAAEKIRSAKRVPLPPALRDKPASTGTPLRNSADLAAALKRTDGETVVLPSGRRTTVGTIRVLAPQVEARLGRPLTATAGRPDLSGSAVKVDAGSDWEVLLRRPDGTVLEAPNGTRITVGELKQSLAASGPARRPPPGRR